MDNVVVVSGLVILVIEYILGKTKWVKANSTIELFLNGILGFLKFFKRG